MLIKAPYIITNEGPPLKDHALRVESGIIKEIAPYKELNGEECLELPNTILSPGFINCHCHLELSQLPEPLPYPGSFIGWIEELGRLKLQMTAAQTEAAMRSGIAQLIEGGTTTVADHISAGTPLKTLLDSPLEGVAYVEVLGVETSRAELFYKQAIQSNTLNFKLKTLNFSIVPTPHSPYSLLPEIFRKILLATEAPLSIHIAESYEEYCLFRENCGPLFDFLSTKGKTPPTLGETPLHYLHRQGLLLPKTMAIHANYLEEGDIELLQNYAMSVVHCPGSHAYFGHDRFPLGLLEEAKINIALGTDSLASNESLSMIRQMQIALDNFVELTPEMILKMATIHGARALGREKEIGSIAIGKKANIIGIPHRYPKQSLHENILQAEKISFGMIRGEA